MKYTTDYELLLAQLDGFIESEPYYIPLLSNASALIYDSLEGLNWAGFYLLLRDDELVLGPFQGKVACIKIPVGKGVCGTAVAENTTQRIADVHEFPGHIACDSASNSEIVVPIRDKDGKVRAVLDIDSTEFDRFDAEDQKNLELMCQKISDAITWEY